MYAPRTTQCGNGGGDSDDSGGGEDLPELANWRAHYRHHRTSRQYQLMQLLISQSDVIISVKANIYIYIYIYICIS